MKMCLRSTATIVLITLIFCIPSSGYDFQQEEIWIHQGTFTIGNGDRAEIGSFTIRNYATDGDGFRLILYHNGDYTDDFYLDDSLNNEYIYDNYLKIVAEESPEGTITFNAFLHDFEEVWIFRERHRVGIGETVEYNGISVGLLEINGDQVLLKTVYENKEAEDIFAIRDVKKYDDTQVRLTFIDTNSAVIELYTPGKPGIEIIDPDLSGSYPCNETINLDVFVKNTGEIPLRGVSMEIAVDFGTLPPESFHTTTIEPGKSKKVSLVINPGITPSEKEMNIDLKVVGYDYLGNEQKEETILTTDIQPFITIVKEHGGANLSLENNDASTLPVILTVSNYASSETSVHIEDEILDSFLLIDQDLPEWDLIIPAGSSQNVEYTIAATEPGNYTLPPAIAKFGYQGNSYEVMSETPENVIVEGTKIAISKSANVEYTQEGDIVRISLTAANEGTTEATVKISDEIPAGIEFVSGETSWTGLLEPHQAKTLKYMIVAGDKDIHLPAAELIYESTDSNGKEVSNSLTIFSGEAPVQDAGDRPDAQQMGRLGLTGFLLKAYLAVFSILLVGPLGVYLYINRRP